MCYAAGISLRRIAGDFLNEVNRRAVDLAY
jgi:hypothetical protein